MYDNGSTPDSPPVKRKSTSPDAPDFLGGAFPTLLGGPCHKAVACMGGPNQGMICSDPNNDNLPDDSLCPESVCDACPVRGGVTTEDEMFILLGQFYLVPEPSGFLLRATAVAVLALAASRRRRTGAGERRIATSPSR